MAAVKATVSVTGGMIAVGSSIGTSVTGERTALGTIGIPIVAVGTIVLQIAEKGRRRKGGIQGQGLHKRGPQSKKRTITEKISPFETRTFCHIRCIKNFALFTGFIKLLNFS